VIAAETYEEARQWVVVGHTVRAKDAVKALRHKRLDHRDGSVGEDEAEGQATNVRIQHQAKEVLIGGVSAATKLAKSRVRNDLEVQAQHKRDEARHDEEWDMLARVMI